jgi:hypothetical protein
VKARCQWQRQCQCRCQCVGHPWASCRTGLRKRRKVAHVMEELVVQEEGRGERNEE